MTRSSKLNPAVRALLEAMDAEGRPPLESLPVAEARKATEGMKALAGDPEPLARVEDVQIAGPGGALMLRVYTPEGDASPRPAFVYMHGGGWVIGNLDSHDNICRLLASRSGAVGVAVDYRLSPEAKFPAAIDDCYAATEWVSANAARLGIDPARIAVVGDSAGGNLATVVAIKSRDRKGPSIALQAMVYPVTNLRAVTPSREEFAEGYFLSRAGMDWFTDQYVAQAEDASHPEASPLLTEDLSDLPPALVITAECDPLRDEGEAYARRLEQAGVAVEYRCYPGMIHPFLSMLGILPAAREAADQVAGAIRGAKAASA
jgi:acetyl esterase